MVASIVSMNPAVSTTTAKKMENVSEKDSKITFKEWWTGEKTLTSVVAREIGLDGFADWIEDKDLVCTDGQDDGKLSFKESLANFGKGFAGIIKTAIKHPIVTGLSVAAAAGLCVLTSGAILPAMVAAGIATGAGMIGVGAYKAATAETDAEAKQAWQTIGTGTFATLASFLSAKPSLKAAAKAGVTSAQGADDMSTIQAVGQTFKSTPEALKVSGMNAKGNVLTWQTGVVHAHSNKLQGSHEYMSKANDVQAYRFNPNGTPEEILANNPGVYRGADGNYYLPNKSNAAEPYLIDTTKEQMIMLYGGDDMAVCDGAIFKGSYVDKAAYHADKTLNYQDPTKLQYGQVVDVTKQAPGGFKILPEGTKIQTLEGVRTVKAGEVVALDHAGNPYVTTAQNILKRNTGLSSQAIDELLSTQGIKITHARKYAVPGDFDMALEIELGGQKYHKVYCLGDIEETGFTYEIASKEGVANWILKNSDKLPTVMREGALHENWLNLPHELH